MEILVHMLACRHSAVLMREKSAFIKPILAPVVLESWNEFKKCRKRNTFVWDQRLVDIVLQPGKKWMEDIHTIYTPMLWDEKHWVGLAINLDMGYVEILDPLPSLHKECRVEKFMQPNTCKLCVTLIILLCVSLLSSVVSRSLSQNAYLTSTSTIAQVTVVPSP